MDEELKAILRDPQIGDAVKAALIPEMMTAKAAPVPPRSLGRILNNGPVIAALASICTLAISEGVRVYLADEKSEETLTLDTSDKAHEQSLERLKFQFDVIRSALDDNKSPKERAETLLFLAEVELLDGLNKEALVKWGESESVPGLRNPAEAPRGLTGQEYKSLLGAEAYGADTAALIPENDELTAILGCPVMAGADGRPTNPAVVSLDAPFPMVVDWDRSATVRKIRVHEAVAPYLEDALNRIQDQNLQDTISFGGMYNARRVRGSNRWSVHSWAAEIDLNPGENTFGMDESEFRMHPGIVAAFKQAGFAWRGDLGADAMSFVISRDSLQEIRADGYSPRIAPEDCLD